MARMATGPENARGRFGQDKQQLSRAASNCNPCKGVRRIETAPGAVEPEGAERTRRDTVRRLRWRWVNIVCNCVYENWLVDDGRLARPSQYDLISAPTTLLRPLS